GRSPRNSDDAPKSRRRRQGRADSDGGAAASRAGDRRYGRAGIVRLAPWKHVRSWWKTYHANFVHSITSEVIEFGCRPGHLPGHRRSPMLMLSLLRPLAVAIPWTLNLAIRLLARSLQLPEPVVHDTGVF